MFSKEAEPVLGLVACSAASGKCALGRCWRRCRNSWRARGRCERGRPDRTRGVSRSWRSRRRERGRRRCRRRQSSEISM